MVDNELSALGASSGSLLVLFVLANPQPLNVWVVSIVLAMFEAYVLGGLLKGHVGEKVRYAATDYLAAFIPLLVIYYYGIQVLPYQPLCYVVANYMPTCNNATVSYYSLYSPTNLVALAGGIIAAYFARFLIHRYKIP